MNKTPYTKELVLSIILVLLLLFVVNPGMILMPSMSQMSLGILLLILFVLFGAYIWREKAHDEREQVHISFAGRYAYFAGISILMLGTLYEYFTSHKVDTWMVLALVGMILTKTFGRIWAERHK
jgi:drug/metabolite transporter (DMT)-like permease